MALGTAKLSVVLSWVSFKLSIIYAECRNWAHFAECTYAECHFAECRVAKILVWQKKSFLRLPYDRF
jgi:hypothetical protein